MTRKIWNRNELISYLEHNSFQVIDHDEGFSLVHHRQRSIGALAEVNPGDWALVCRTPETFTVINGLLSGITLCLLARDPEALAYGQITIDDQLNLVAIHGQYQA